MRKIFLFLFFCFLLTQIFSETVNAREINNISKKNYTISQHKTNIVLNAIKKLLKDNAWYVKIEGRELFAYKFTNEFIKLKLIIDHKFDSASDIYKTTVITDKMHIREITIKNEYADDTLYIRDKIIPYILERINTDYENHSNPKKIYFGSISAGYSRTSDNYRFYPEYRQGSFYMSGSLSYDPAVNITASSITLGAADYFSSDFYFTLDSRIRENSFNIDLLIYGKNNFESARNNTKRSLYGFFTGFEYFRPGFNDNVLQWNRKIYKKQPHIQYGIWRAIQGTIINTNKSNNGIFKNYLSLAIGPGINSSLTANDISEDEEDDLSHIFKSIKYRKQNYYYSAVATVSAGLIADKVYNFLFRADYNGYFFIPVENEEAYDLMNILKFSTGYYLTQKTLFAVNYEFWNIDSMIKDAGENHSWNRLIIEIKYFF